MARRSSSYSNYSQRDDYSIASYNLLRSILSRPVVPLGDRRTFYPDVYRPADVVGRRVARTLVLAAPTARERRSNVMPKDVFRFAEPNRVLICGRRQVRKEVLFAKRKTGAGARARRDRNMFSDISCR